MTKYKYLNASKKIITFRTFLIRLFFYYYYLLLDLTCFKMCLDDLNIKQMRNSTRTGIPFATLSFRSRWIFQIAAAFLQRRVVHVTHLHVNGTRPTASTWTVVDRTGRRRRRLYSPPRWNDRLQQRRPRSSRPPRQPVSHFIFSIITSLSFQLLSWFIDWIGRGRFFVRIVPVSEFDSKWGNWLNWISGRVPVTSCVHGASAKSTLSTITALKSLRGRWWPTMSVSRRWGNVTVTVAAARKLAICRRRECSITGPIFQIHNVSVKPFKIYPMKLWKKSIVFKVFGQDSRSQRLWLFEI